LRINHEGKSRGQQRKKKAFPLFPLERNDEEKEPARHDVPRGKRSRGWEEGKRGTGPLTSIYPPSDQGRGKKEGDFACPAEGEEGGKKETIFLRAGNKKIKKKLFIPAASGQGGRGRKAKPTEWKREKETLASGEEEISNNNNLLL